jgi:hypothetical protein
MKRLSSFLVLLVLTSTLCIAQPAKITKPAKTVTLNSLLVRLVSGQSVDIDSSYQLRVVSLKAVIDSLVSKGFATDSAGRLIVKGKMNMIFPGVEDGVEINLWNLHFEDSVSIKLKTDLRIEYCLFERLAEISGSGNAVRISNCIFPLNFNKISNDDRGLILLSGNQFRHGVKYNGNRYKFGLTGEYWDAFYDSALLKDGNLLDATRPWPEIDCKDCRFFGLEANVFDAGGKLFLVYLHVDGSRAVDVIDNRGRLNLVFTRSIITQIFRYYGNHLVGFIDVEDLDFPGSSIIQWESIKNGLAISSHRGIPIDYKSMPAAYKFDTGNRSEMQWINDSDSVALERYYAGNQFDDLLDKKDYDRLLFAYKRVRDTYVERGNLEESNSAFVSIKELEGRRLLAVANAEGGMRNWIRYRLNRLMKLYADHGTDPSKSIVISIWIIFFFGLFYFFFPSDWDVTSKKELIQKFKDFAQKNDKGYVKPFFVLVLGFLTSLVNGITLSLNSFVTLGFGNIPTHGIARYVCILEGFLGWFLLSIFTVAMINQVLG